MKKIMSIFGLVLFSSTLFAKASPEEKCTMKIESAVKSTAKLMGIKDKFSLQMSEPEDAGKNMMDISLKSYSTSSFLIGDGYISGSGASVVVQPNSKSCEIIKMTISVGQ